MLIDIRKKKITSVNENYVKTDSSTHVHWSWKTEDKGFLFFFPLLSFREQKTYFKRLYKMTFKPFVCSQIPIDNMSNEMEQRVEPHNDYFSTQFLLNFVILGTHNITVESSVIDSNGIVWKTGPKTTIFVKSLEDPYSQQVRLQQQQGQSSSQQQQQRTAYSRF